jgi:hypothetical protein
MADECKHRSVAGILGMNAGDTRDFLGNLVIASIFIAAILGVATTILLGMHIYYTHYRHMTDAGYVLRTRNNGWSADITEWVKEGTPEAKFEQPTKEEKDK